MHTEHVFATIPYEHVFGHPGVDVRAGEYGLFDEDSVPREETEMRAQVTRGRETMRQVGRRGLQRRRSRAEELARLAGIALVIAAGLVVILSLATDVNPPARFTWSAVSVDPSGTLWEIAAEHPVEGLSTAQTVDLIRDENGLASSTLHTGQTLVVPANADNLLSVAQR